MPVDALQMVEIIELMENYIDKIRPPERLRKEVNIVYKIDGQSITIYEIRPFLLDKTKRNEHAVAKTTFIKSKNEWKVFWMRSDLKWHAYSPKPTVKTLVIL
jgi:hypothetical protein